jgi:hypothetical protein
MKKWMIGFIGLVGIVGILVVIPTSHAVMKTLGSQAQCDTALSGCSTVPLSPSFLCDGTGIILDCPQFASPDYADTTGLRFFGITNRANPGRCVKSTNGGTTWGLCDATTISPFTGALDFLGANFAVASDGSLIAAGDQGTNNCIIRRSTDYGVSWTTVFTDSVTVNVSCGILFGNPTSNTLRCASSGNYCVMIATITGSFDLLAYYSTNNGASWTTGITFNIVTIDGQISVVVNSSGTGGSLTHFATNYNVVGRKFANTSGGDWTVTGLIPTSPGSADGEALRCTSAYIGSGQNVFCGPDITATTTYRAFSHSGASTPSLIASVIPPNGLTNAQAPDFMVAGYGSSTAYVVARNNLSTVLNIWITRDSFGSLFQIGTLTPASPLIAACCHGDMFSYNGKIYFTSGSSGTTAFFGVIQ